MLTPIPGSQVTRQVQEQLTAFIAAENLKTGDRLPSLREFTEALGVSRPSVREGLRALEALGLVEIRHGSGIYVSSGVPPIAVPLTGGEATVEHAARELLAVRLALEPEVAALAAMTATDEDLARLAKDVEDFRRDFGRVRNPASDIGFHLDLCRATHNSAFVAIMGWIAQFYAKRAKAPRRKDIDDHAAILEAVQRRDPEAARAEMKRHLTWIGEVLDSREGRRGRRSKAG
ncbi:MAG TPA: FadR/GntR family transcriptional regulator [Bauldia sp.]|nr:FadR/GntR family transcriptional regulator [Bauldia sp.]